MAGIRVCLPGKHTAVVSVTPLKVKHPVGHADHSKEAATTLVAEVAEHVGVLYVNLHVSYACVMQLFLSRLKAPYCIPQVITPMCLIVYLEGTQLYTVLITPLKVQNHVSTSGEQYSKQTR